MATLARLFVQKSSAIQMTAIPSEALPTNSNISSGEKGCMNGAARTSRYILASGLDAMYPLPPDSVMARSTTSITWRATIILANCPSLAANTT